jgi:hypothetical protein
MAAMYSNRASPFDASARATFTTVASRVNMIGIIFGPTLLNCDFMAEDFVVETTNESGVVEHERVSVNETVLQLRDRSLVRIVGPLARATTLQRLVVRRPINTFLVANLTHSRCFRSAVRQLLCRRASVCARVDTARPARRESRSLAFVSSLSLLTPLQLAMNRLSSLPAAVCQMSALTVLIVRTDTAFARSLSHWHRLLALWESPPRPASRDRPPAIAELVVGIALMSPQSFCLTLIAVAGGEQCA